MIQVFNNFFSPDMYNKMVTHSLDGWRLNNDHIEKDHTDKFYLEDCILHMEKIFKKKVSVYRSYSNGDSIIPRYLHIDRNSSHTALLYLNDHYNKDWLGGTVIFENDQVNYINFLPNRLVLFDAHLEHIGSNFQNTNNLRLINVWKINIKE
tara:strand:- start:2075 stop:2527 length:453 start_codon:yes stop_codon:yes gene_type:complete